MKSETYKNRVMSNVFMKNIFMTTDNNFCYRNESHNLSLNCFPILQINWFYCKNKKK